MIKHSKRVLKFINGNTSSKGIAPSNSKGRDYFKNLYSNFFFKFIYPIITASISFVLSMLLK